eukprot:6344239-Amphidinium_carterae.1
MYSSCALSSRHSFNNDELQKDQNSYFNNFVGNMWTGMAIAEKGFRVSSAVSVSNCGPASNSVRL